MLLELRVKDFGIIEDINWKLDSGFNVITGETGAGKSLLIDAVELLLIGSASENIIRYGTDQAFIEGVFSFSQDNKSNPVKLFLVDKGLDSEENTLSINFEIRRHKPGIIRINGRTATRTVLRQLGMLLIDIHGQSEHLSLLDKKYHLEFLDSYAHIDNLKNAFQTKLVSFNKTESELQTLDTQKKEIISREELLKFQINEIKTAGLKDNEDEQLEKERNLISFSEKLKEYSHQVYQALYENSSSQESSSVFSKMNIAILSLRKLTEIDPVLIQQLEYLEKTVYSVEDMAKEIRSYGDNLESNTERLEDIESRLELIRNLKRKYGKTIPEIQSYLAKSEKEIDGIQLSSERQVYLKNEIVNLRKEMGRLATELSQIRTIAVLKLAGEVHQELRELDMGQMQFEVSIKQKQSAQGICGPDGQTFEYNDAGIDIIEFMVSTNPGEPLKPLVKIASTGEISRFTLALKSALSEVDKIPVMIFDEIDIGIGGRSGDIIGRKLWSLAQLHQVICVTHLPQIAAYADAHFFIHKEISRTRTISTLERLSAKMKLEEMALMLSGAGFTDTALKNATELLRKADEWKKHA